MKILLLGGNGYLGSVLYQKLIEHHELHSVDLCLFGADLGYSVKQNYKDTDISGYDIVILLAGHSSVQMCQHSPQRSWTNNVEYFNGLCDKLNKEQLLIYASSASVYGNKPHKSHEDLPINYSVITDYDLQKITIDLIAAKNIALGKRLIGLRFGTINGISPNTRHELMLNSMVRTALNTGVVNTKNKHMKRSILGINDAVNAILSFAENNKPSGYYNISSFNSDVETMANYVSHRLGVPVVDHGVDSVFYNFELSTDKVHNTCGFVAQDTIESLVDDLVIKYNTVRYENRNTDKDFINYL